MVSAGGRLAETTFSWLKVVSVWFQVVSAWFQPPAAWLKSTSAAEVDFQPGGSGHCALGSPKARQSKYIEPRGAAPLGTRTYCPKRPGPCRPGPGPNHGSGPRPMPQSQIRPACPTPPQEGTATLFSPSAPASPFSTPPPSLLLPPSPHSFALLSILLSPLSSPLHRV